MVPLWQQKKGNPVLWDYHVIAMANGLVYDYDTALSFPCNAQEYVMQAFRPYDPVQETYRQWFRVIPSREFLLTFASDRSHMRRQDGSYTAPPPPYDPIRTDQSTMNLMQFRTMDPQEGFGVVYSLQEFVQFVGQQAT